MRSVADLTEGIKFHGADTTLSFTNGSVNLRILNQVYRRLCAQFDWPELLTNDSTLLTDKTSNLYVMPDSPIFSKIKAIKVKDGDAEDEDSLVYPMPSQVEYEKAHRKNPQSVPDFFFFKRSGGTGEGVRFMLSLYPKPKYDGKTIRIEGILEPDELTQESDTVFRLALSDDALEHMVASQFYLRDGFPARAQTETALAMEILKPVFDSIQVPSDAIKTLIGAEHENLAIRQKLLAQKS